MLYIYLVEFDRDFDYIILCNNKYIICIILVIEIFFMLYLVYSLCYCYVLEEISGYVKMLFCIYLWLYV